VSSVDHGALLGTEIAEIGSLDGRTREILERRRRTAAPPSRGWLIRRALVAADLVGLTTSFLLALAVFGGSDAYPDPVGPGFEFLVFLGMLPIWVLLGKLYGLYDQDEERTDHSTIDELAGVLNLVTLGAWLVFAGSWLTGAASPNAPRMIAFWGLAIVAVSLLRALARSLCRQSVAYLQNTVIVGAGDVGQLIGRKLVQHPEYGINLVGFVDSRPRIRRVDLDHVSLLGPPERLPDIIRTFDIERVVIAFSSDSHAETLELIHSLRKFDVQLDVVPRLFEIVGPRVGIHTVEGLPLVGLPPARPRRSSRVLKRWVDILGALLGLLLTAPLFAYVAWRIKRDSPGPVFFRQQRLGMDMREFTALKFRTMRVDTDDSAHRAYIKATMSAGAAPERNGLYKLERDDAITWVGTWLRKTSLDELPQLLNVLRGEMSLVGPRPCLDYETEGFEPQHFERFLVPPGLTGLWQVTARAHSTFREALDMDVAYVRGWSLGLDLRLLFRTPVQLARQRGTA
jgi:exopolysaccharide biosynthesis polyprenyl glycosylphosphotransferase